MAEFRFRVGGDHVHPVAAVEVDVGGGCVRALVLATDEGNIWDPGRGSSRDLGRNDLWSLARAEIYYAADAPATPPPGQSTLTFWGVLA